MRAYGAFCRMTVERTNGSAAATVAAPTFTRSSSPRCTSSSVFTPWYARKNLWMGFHQSVREPVVSPVQVHHLVRNQRRTPQSCRQRLRPRERPNSRLRAPGGRAGGGRALRRRLPEGNVERSVSLAIQWATLHSNTSFSAVCERGQKRKRDALPPKVAPVQKPTRPPNMSLLRSTSGFTERRLANALSAVLGAPAVDCCCAASSFCCCCLARRRLRADADADDAGSSSNAAQFWESLIFDTGEVGHARR